MDESKDKAVSVEQLLSDLKSGNRNKSHDAVHELVRLPYIPTQKVAAILRSAGDAFSREQAAYVLSWTHGRGHDSSRLKALLKAFNKPGEDAKVRAQVLEGFANQQATNKHRLWSRIEAATLAGLSDESVEVRFWACFAAGQLKMKAALPKLQEIKENDKSLASMWYVAEEAEDAIDWIHGRDTESRMPMGSRDKPHDIQFSMWFPVRKSAEQAAEEVRQLGYDIKKIESETGESAFLKFTKKQMIVERSEMIALRESFAALAAKYEGKYWDWGIDY